MSSKGRKRKDVAGGDSEYFPTPHWCVHRFIEKAKLPMGRWIEPCAGHGDIIIAVNSVRPGQITWHANELRPECKDRLEPLCERVTIGSFQDIPEDNVKPYDVYISNPPFSLALDVINKGFSVADHVVMLLRLNYIGTTERTKFFHEYMPDILVLPERPSFDGHGTDSIEYAWFVWGPNQSRRRRKGSIEVLDNTPKGVRKAHKPVDLKITNQTTLL